MNPERVAYYQRVVAEATKEIRAQIARNGSPGMQDYRAGLAWALKALCRKRPATPRKPRAKKGS